MINEKLNTYARILNSHDTKNLSQKLTKTVEEVGELAKVILPFEDASGTLHRFTERNQILEECIDAYLCIQSIIHELEYSQDEVDNMAQRKLEKWGGIQQNEKRIEDKPIPFEIHVTASCSTDITKFKTVCGDIGVKPIVLDLQTNSGVMEDVMTSSVHVGTNRSAYEEVRRISKELMDAGFDVIRQKIETVPWHPAAPKDQHGVMPKSCYFESHLAVVVYDQHQERQLSIIANHHNAHLSQNRFKTLDNGSYVMMVTYRSYVAGRKEFERQLKDLKDALAVFEVDKEIIEFSIWDTNLTHDAEWINS